MVRDVATRWNSTAALIKRGLELKVALQILVVMGKYNKPRGVCLGRFRLNADEWKVLEQLSPLLDVKILYLNLQSAHHLGKGRRINSKHGRSKQTRLLGLCFSWLNPCRGCTAL